MDTKGGDLQGRTDGMNQWKSGFPWNTRRARWPRRPGRCAFGLSGEGAITKDMVKSMAEKPIIFAMASPDPEMTVGRRGGGARRRHHGDRPLRLSQSGQSGVAFLFVFRGALECGRGP